MPRLTAVPALWPGTVGTNGIVACTSTSPGRTSWVGGLAVLFGHGKDGTSARFGGVGGVELPGHNVAGLSPEGHIYQILVTQGVGVLVDEGVCDKFDLKSRYKLPLEGPAGVRHLVREGVREEVAQSRAPNEHTLIWSLLGLPEQFLTPLGITRGNDQGLEVVQELLRPIILAVGEMLHQRLHLLAKSRKY